MEDFLCGNQNDEIVTPESLAWKLLMDNEIDDLKGVIMSFIDGCDENTNYENQAGQFEILVTMYMEMVFGLLKINHISKQLNEKGELDADIDLEKSFSPDLTNLSLDDLTVVFREKFKKIRIFLSTSLILDSDPENQKNFGSKSQYYCRILLKDLLVDRTYFWTNRQRIDPDKRYTFVIRNDPDKKQNKIDDFYAVCALPNMKVKISFSPITVVDCDNNYTTDYLE